MVGRADLGAFEDVPPARLRMSRTMLLPVVLFALCLLPVVLISPWGLLLLLLPVLLAVWILRVGVTVGDDGIGVQSVAGRRRIGWDELAGIRVGRRRDLWLVTTRGTELRLPVLRARDLPRLSALSGGRIDVSAPPAA
jgi:Bacterial PH domain